MAQELKTGDLVRLNSGGPLMTVTSIYQDHDGDQRAACTWFDSDNNNKEADFKEAALTKEE